MKSNAKTVFKNIQKKLLAVQRVAPRVLANEGVKVFMDNFRTESYEGDKWETPERKEPGTKAYRYPKMRDLGRRTRPTLVGKTRKLKNATNTSVKEANTHRIRWANWLPYAKRHNDGLSGMPKRSFMKAGPVFRRRIRMKYASMYRQALK